MRHSTLDTGGRIFTVLVVEDEGVIRMNVADFLEDMGFAVVEASNAAEAVGALHDPSRPIDVVFSDVRMPGEMDGLALAAWLRQHYAHLPVILTSGDIGQANSARQGLVGDLFLPKPYPLNAVAEKISQVMQSVAA